MVLCSAAASALELSYPFGDHMVLQRGHEIPVWGTADAGSKVTVSFGSARMQAIADRQGKWMVKLPAQKANEEAKPLEVRSGSKNADISDVLVGDVWYATGQSNMRWMLKQCATGGDAIKDSSDKGLRLFNHSGNLHPGGNKYSVDFLKEMNEDNYYSSKGWQVSGPSTSGEMSGVAYFFAQKLRGETKVPIGIVNVSVGGTPIEAHIAPDIFESDKELSPLLKDWWKNDNYPKWCRGRAAHNLSAWFADSSLKGQTPPHPFTPMFLWKAGPARYQPMPIKGVIWYQGESNAGKDGTPEAVTDGSLNKRKFKMLVDSWRQGWGDPELPVYHVQLPGMNRKWPVFREMQFEVSREIPNVGMAVSIDVGHPTNVHPNKKKPVGDRLARLALVETYGQDIVPNGPMYMRNVVKGGNMIIDFENNKGMKASNGDSIRGFEIAGSNKKFHPASATVKGDYLHVSSAEVKKPVAVRYAWDNDPDCNLVNAEGIPASPFRTDRWKDVSPSGNVKKGAVGSVVVARKKSDLVRVACIGDSITYGSGIKDRKMTYPAQLQKLLGDKYEVQNFGNPGRGVLKKSKRGSGKRGYIFMAEHKKALEFEPHIVICNLGINDVMDFDKYSADFVGDYKDLLESYKTLDTYPRLIVWRDLAPLFKGQKFFEDPRIEKLNDAIAKVAAEMKIENLNMAKPFRGKGELFPDHIHPNAAGATIIAKETAKMLKK